MMQLGQIEDNKVKRINTAFEIAKALAHNGGIRDSMIQVVNTNEDQVIKIEKKFENVIKNMSKFFSRVNHSYFVSSNQHWLEVTDYKESLVDLIDDM